MAMNRNLVTGSGLVIALALFLGVNVISNQALTSWRLDVTENALYTLSDGTLNILEDLEEPVQERILDALEDSDRAAVEQSLTYPEYSAGRLMQREVVTAPEHWTVGETIEYLRGAEELPDQF